jgi:hypothetical protein
VAEAPSADAQKKADTPPEAVKTAPEPAAVEPEAEDVVDAAPEAEAADAAEDADPDAAPDSFDDEGADDPLFEATDRRGAIIADRHGITFRLDDQEAEFGWDEIGAVEIDTPRFGRRFSVTVYISARRWFQSDVEAPTRAILKEWTYDLDKILDTHFEAGTAEEAEESEEESDDLEVLDSEAAENAESPEDTEVADDAEPSAEEASATAEAEDADPEPEAGTEAKADTDVKPAAKSKA